MRRLMVVFIFSCFVGNQVFAQWKPAARPEINLNLTDPEEQSTGQGKKSVFLAGALSAILPGMGELYVGNFKLGKYLLISEVVLWITYGSYYFQNEWLQTDARSFAQFHAGANFDAKGNDYFVNVGNYGSLEEFNQSRMQLRSFDEVYRNLSGYNWKWDNETNRVQYRNIRISADEMARNSKFALSALVVNRIISIFVAIKSTAANNNAIERSWNLEAVPLGIATDRAGIELRYSTTF
jgi:hypothetical protein